MAWHDIFTIIIITIIIDGIRTPFNTTWVFPPNLYTGPITDMNVQYEAKHLAFENHFWSTKMGLQGASIEQLAVTKSEYESFLGDSAKLKLTREFLKVRRIILYTVYDETAHSVYI
jgi:hypothetical protein